MSLNQTIACIPYESVSLFGQSVFNSFNLIFGDMLFGLGIVGNILGLYVSSCESPQLTVLAKLFPNVIVNEPDTPNATQSNPVGQHNNGRNSSVKRSTQARSSVVKNISVNQYLLKWFFGINLVNSFLLILSPILKLHGAKISKGFWVERGWISFIAKINYPVTKPLISFGFLVYVIYFGNQTLAVFKPFFYKAYVTLRRINITLVATLAYAILWYIPIFLWFRVYSVYVCDEGEPSDQTTTAALIGRGSEDANEVVRNQLSGSDGIIDGHYVYAYDWVIRNFKGVTRRHVIGWECYQISRELFVNLIPFVTIIVFKYLTYMRRKIKVDPKSVPAPSARDEGKDPEIVIDNPNVVNMYEDPDKSDNSDAVVNEVDKIDVKGCNTNTSATPVVLHGERSRKIRQVVECQQHRRTLWVLTFEFVFLMLPISLFQMFMDFLRSVADSQTMATVFIFLTMLQFVYVSCTFFINLTFNPMYRKMFVEIWEKDIGIIILLFKRRFK